MGSALAVVVAVAVGVAVGVVVVVVVGVGVGVVVAVAVGVVVGVGVGVGVFQMTQVAAIDLKAMKAFANQCPCDMCAKTKSLLATIEEMRAALESCSLYFENKVPYTDQKDQVNLSLANFNARFLA